MNLTEEIINKIPDNLETKLEKAFYIYIETCKMFNFDPRLDSLPFLINLIIVNRHPNIKNIKDNNIVCTVWSKIYVDLLKSIDIKASIHNTMGHDGVVIELDEETIYADATIDNYMDLSRVKHNDRIHNFYLVDDIYPFELPLKRVDTTFDKKIEELYNKIGYEIVDSEKLKKIKEEIRDIEKTSDKIEYIINNINLKGFNTIDDAHYFRNVISNCLEYSYNSVKYTYLKRVNESGEVDLLWTISVKDKEDYTYYLFDKLDNIKRCSKEELEEYARLGYGSTSSDFKYPLKFKVPGNSLKYFINKIKISNKPTTNIKIK